MSLNKETKPNQNVGVDVWMRFADFIHYDYLIKSKIAIVLLPCQRTKKALEHKRDGEISSNWCD